MDRGTEAMAKGEYAEAEKFAEMAQQIAPNEPAAAALAWKARVQRHYEIDLKTRAAKEETVLNGFQGVDAAAIVDPDVMNRGIGYAKSFSDLSKSRRRFDLNRSTKTPQLMLIDQKLNELVDLNFDKTPPGGGRHAPPEPHRPELLPRPQVAGRRAGRADDPGVAVDDQGELRTP